MSKNLKILPCPTTPLRNPEWTPVEPEKIVSGKPESAYHMLYSNGDLYHGIYECKPGKWKVSYNEDEFCALLEGHVRLTNEAGESQDFRAPESFMIPSGYSGTWEAVTPVRKIFVLYEPKK